MTIRVFKLKAADIAEKSGISETTLSRYRNKKHDVYSLNAFDILRVLPADAQKYFLELLSSNSDTPPHPPKASRRALTTAC